MASFGPTLGQPWMVAASMVPFFLAMSFWYFFRDPERAIASGVCSPADGKVVRVDQIDDPDLGRVDRLSIFMSPLDVHVNRFPVPGNVVSVTHIPGKHVPAFNKDSDRNERVITHMKTELGEIKVIQIAGAVARRIVPYATKGDTVAKGEKLGLIRLGSRCDLLVPEGTLTWTVQVGDRVQAGRSEVAAWD
ncbi:MAG: phosphatidylserine decarboxylase [Thermoplasmatota archaeon]